MAASSCCLLFIVAVILSLAIEEGKQGIRLYKIREFLEHNAWNCYVDPVRTAAAVCVVAIAFVRIHPFRYNLCSTVTFC